MKKVKKLEYKVEELLKPVSILFCKDLITGSDGSLSLIRLVEELTFKSLPAAAISFGLVVQIRRIEAVSISDFLDQQVILKVSLASPTGKEADLFYINVNSPESVDGRWKYMRLGIDMTGKIGFKSRGEYFFKLYGKTKDSDFQFMMERELGVFTVDDNSTAETEPELLDKKKSRPSKTSKRN